MQAGAIASSIIIAAAWGCSGASARAVADPAKAQRTISLRALEDKVRGGWAGQMIGVSYGAPTEFRALGKTYDADLPWAPDRVSNAIDQDDLYVEMTFAEVMDREGLDAPIGKYAEMFRDSKYSLWHANAAARRHLANGVPAPLPGSPEHNIHANDIDFQIEADFIGLMTPGLPRESNRLCDRIGRVMNHGDGLYGGMFVCGMYGAAFFEDDPRRVVEAGLACIPAESGYAKAVRDVLAAFDRHPGDWRATWSAIQDRWDLDDGCPDGALHPFNIDARLNGAYIAIGLLHGRRDFGRTLEISTRCGQDSDCNPSSAAGVLGVMLGWSGISDEWKSGIAKIGTTKFRFTGYSYEDIVRSTLERARKAVLAAGGRVEGDALVIPRQDPEPPPLEQWDMGVPDKAVEAGDAAWTWAGAWTKEKAGMAARGAGSEAVLRFSGTAVAVVGPCSGDGGRATVLLDGKEMRPADAFIVERTHDNDLWHASGLAPGEHELRIATRDDADPRSKGKAIVIQRAVVFRAR